MSALEARTNSGTGIHPRGRIHSDLYFHGSSTATSPEVTQPPSSEKHLYGGFARLLHQPIDTVTVMHSKRQLHQNWSRGVTSHSEVTKDTVEGYVLTKLVEWCLIWDIFTLEDTQQPSTKVHFEIVLMTLADFISETHFTEAQSFSSAKMKCPFQPLVVSLILISVCGNNGQVDQLEKGGDGSESVDPQGGQVNSKNLSTPLLAADFHKENTVTNDWITEGEEDEDYLDLEKLFGEDDDYIDIIDVVSPTDSEASAGNILQLFHGKSRIQRLNILNAKFAFNLYRALREQASPSDNIFIAPVGISTAMGMLSLGLKGETHEQVHSILHFKDFVNASSKYEIMTIHNLFRKLTHRLFRRNFGYTLRSVNDLYIQKQFPILNDFKTKVKEYYFAEAQAADFSDPAFISKTNNHILKLTKGLIKDALENIDPATEMMILNCIYFKGSWVNKFPTEMTHNHNFRLNEREVVKVSMMQTKGSFLATNDQELDCDVLQLEYVGGISMLIVVPHKLSGMKTLETQLTPQVVERWQKSMTNRTREVLLPKFKLEKNYNLVEALKSMGITALFDKSSNMTGISDQRIAIDLFKHQGTITVNEEGTQAAAVTTVGFMPLTTQVRFNVDRPFLFLVFEHRTSCLLFMGKVANPTKS